MTWLIAIAMESTRRNGEAERLRAAGLHEFSESSPALRRVAYALDYSDAANLRFSRKD